MGSHNFPGHSSLVPDRGEDNCLKVNVCKASQRYAIKNETGYGKAGSIKKARLGGPGALGYLQKRRWQDSVFSLLFGEIKRFIGTDD